MADISALGIKVTSEGVVKTTDELEKFSKATKDASSGSANVEAAFKRTGVTVEQAERYMRKASIQLDEMAKAERAAALATGELSAKKETSAQIARRAEAEQRKYNSALNALRASVDPLGAAQAKLNSQLDLAVKAFSRGDISAKRYEQTLDVLGSRMMLLNSRVGGVGQSFKFTAHEGLNFSRQMADIGVTAAMGMSPLMITLQQGPQLFDILQTAAIRNGTGIGGALRGMAASAGSFTAALGLAAAAAGAAGAGMWAWLETINSDRKAELDAYAESIGLTAEQIERAGGAAVTASDMMLGLWDTIKEALGLEDIFDGLKKSIIDTFRAIAKDAIKNISEIVAAIRVIDDVVNFVGDNIGAIIADGFIIAVNAGIDAIEGLVNKAREAFNKFIGFINPISKMLGFEGIAELGEVNLGRLENKWAGTIKRGMALTGNFAKYSQETASGMYSFIDRAEENMVNRSKKRFDGAVSDAVKKSKAAGKKSGEDFAAEFEGAVLKGLSRSMAKIFKDAEKIAAGIFRDSDAQLKVELEAIQERRRFEEWNRHENQRIAQENRNRALDTAYEIADIIGGSFGDVVAELANAVIPLVDVSNKLGALLESFGKGAILGGAIGGVTGSRTGGAIGGGIGQVLGEEFLTKGLTDMFGKTIGKFAGPIGAIAGGLLGGVIGGMLKSTPRASATVSIIAGEAMDTAIKGSSGKLRKIAGGLANGVIDGLTSLADQLGAQLVGDANVSIGMRKKNYRVDPTGRGVTKTSKGAIDFGDDQAAAIAYAIQVAIQQGVLGGLSESMKRLIMADGDLQTQLQKALNFKSVFDELHQRLDPEGFDLAQLDKWRAGMEKIFAEAGATAEELAKLEELTGLKRAEIVEKYAEKVVNNEELIREKRQLEIQIMELEGKSIEALAARREIERMAADESLRPLYDRIYALQDEAAATEEANRIAEEAAAIQRAIADERYGLEGRLLQLQGDTNALRQREIDALDPANQALLQMIFNLEDFQAQAESAAKAAADAAAAQKSISDEIGGLERQWLELIGDTESLRELRLGDLLSDDARAMQQMIWAEQDRQAAEEAARRAAEEAARAAEQAAQIYARAIEEYNKRVEAARDVLVQAYQRESGALQQTIDKFREFSRSIREFRDSLIAGNNPSLGLAQARATFTSTSRMAGLGSEKALGSFTGDAQAYLDAAQNFGSFDDYQRALAAVLGGSSNAIKGSDSMVSTASMQLDRLTKIMTELGLLNEETVSFNQALTEYNRILTEEAIPDFTKTVSRSIDNLSHQVAEGNSITEETGEVTKITLESIVISMNQVARILGRAEREGRLAVTLDGEPVSGSVTIANVPLPVDQVP